jgi:hypothetical protein
MKKSLTNLEYINSLPCSQRLKDRIIELTKNYHSEKYLNRHKVPFLVLFSWAKTNEGFEYWNSINQSIINNTPIVE